MVAGTNLDLKVKENIIITEECTKTGKCINAIAGRPYYAVHQKVLYLIIKHKVNIKTIYNTYKISLPKKNPNRLSHITGTSIAIRYLVEQMGYKNIVKYKDILKEIPGLYDLREKCDYKDVYCKPKDVVEALKKTKKIIKELSKMNI